MKTTNWIAIIILLVFSATVSVAQTSTFTYQGRFTDGGSPANGVYDMQFKLFDSPTVGAGNQIGSTISNGAVTVTNGVFTVQLDYGAAAFPGADRFLEIGVRPAGSSDPLTVLSPRQQLTATPYAVRALSATTAETATNASQLGGVTPSQFVQTNDSRLSDPRPPTPGSSDYIQNTTSQQIGNFNINGSGTVGGSMSANIVDAATQYNFAGSRVLFANNVLLDTYVGLGAGNANPTGVSNTFVGANAGKSDVGGFSNSFFGAHAGESTFNGTYNSFFGDSAGFSNTSGANNAYFGKDAGLGNQQGNLNSFFGARAGFYNSGNGNTALGSSANVDPNLSNATAIGADASVTQSNSLILGSIDGVNKANADTNVGIGTTAPKAKFHLSGAGIVRARINSDSNAGVSLTLNEQPKWSVAATTVGNFQIFNDATNLNAIWINASNNNVGIGTTSPNDKLEVQGAIRLSTLGSAGSTQLCRNASNQISTCSSSLRYKTNIQPFFGGLSVLNRLRPITFDWKQGGMHDLGFGAEDIAAVEPLLVTRNDKGEVEGVKYDRITAVLVNAVKEQQNQIQEQQRQIAGLKRLVCKGRRHANACR